MATSVAEACCCSLRKSACTLAGHTAGRPWAGHAILVKHDYGLGCATCVHGGPPGHGERLARAREASRVGWVREHGNLVVLRTFSKSAGLAGLRVGWGAFPLAVIGFLWRAKQPYNVGVAAETAACAALENPGYLQARPQGWRAGARDPMWRPGPPAARIGRPTCRDSVTEHQDVLAPPHAIRCGERDSARLRQRTESRWPGLLRVGGGVVFPGVCRLGMRRNEATSRRGEDGQTRRPC